jgi:hypothetical protein
MKVRELKKFKLLEAKYDTFTRNIVKQAINAEDKSKIIVILRPEH